MAERAERLWPDLVLVFLLLGALASPYLAFQALFPDCLICAGYISDEAAEAQDRRAVVAALVLGTVLPIAGMTLGIWAQWHGWRRVFGILMTVSVLLTFLAWRANREPTRDEPPPKRAPSCQEHSGGDNTCPGG